MNRLQKLIHSKIGQILISMLLGVGLATMFRKACNDRNCVVFHAAPLKYVKDKIFKFNDKCYTFKENAEKCDSQKKIVEFEKKLDS